MLGYFLNKTLLFGILIVSLGVAYGDDHHWYIDYVSQDVHVSLESAVERVRRRTGGRILTADTVVRKGLTIHRIKVLTPEGRVRQLRMDARTGEVLSRQRR